MNLFPGLISQISSPSPTFFPPASLSFTHRQPQSHPMVPNPVPLTPKFLHKEKEGVKFTSTRLIRKLLTFTRGVGRGGREEGSDKSLTEILSKPRLVKPLLLPMEERQLDAASDCFALTSLGSRSQISGESVSLLPFNNILTYSIQF